MSKLVVVMTLGILGVSGVSAQGVSNMGGEAHRVVQLWDLENQRRTLLALADSMPEVWINEADHAGQRTFAQQLAHAATGMARVTGRFFGEGQPAYQLPPEAETREYTRSAIREVINEAYDYCERLMKTQSGADRRSSMEFSGQSIPVWQVWDELAEHTAWIAGQTVGNFRKHGMPPPRLTYLFGPRPGGDR